MAAPVSRLSGVRCQCFCREIVSYAKLNTSLARKKRGGKRNTSKRTGRQGKGSGGKLTGESAGTTLVIPASLGWAPRRLRVTLRYSVFKQLVNAGFQYANVRYTPTYCYDVDPLLGSTAMPGFTEYGAIYRFYRLRKSSIKVDFSNTEGSAMMCFVTPVNYDPGSNANPQGFMTSSLLCKKFLIGNTNGNGIGSIKHGVSTDVIAGVRDVQVADSYSAPCSGSSSPANNWYWAVGVYSSANMVTGVYIVVDINCEIEFFELANPSS